MDDVSPIQIAAHAMVTSLGCDAATACAAARAGLSRAAAQQGMTVGSEVDGRPEPVIAHAVPLLTRGFEGQARLQRLLVGGLSELKAQFTAEELQVHRVGFYLSLPDPARLAMGLVLIPDDKARVTHEETAAELGIQPGEKEFAQSLLARAARQAAWPGLVTLRHVALSGHAGGAECVVAAQRDLNRGDISLAIVGAADSLLDDPTLAWLRATNRLKLSGMPIGLMPGEGCAFLALSLTADHPQGTIQAMGLRSEPRTLCSGAISVGEALAEAIDHVVPATGWRPEIPPWFICDQNGEVYRANEWGHALVRLRSANPALENPTLWAPAASFGDTGSASGLIATCVALQAFARGYAPSSSAVVTSSSETELRAALVVCNASIQSGSARDFHVKP